MVGVGVPDGAGDVAMDVELLNSWSIDLVTSIDARWFRLLPTGQKHLAQRLRERRVRIVEFTFSNASVGRLAHTTHRLLKDRQLKLYDDEALIDELGNVRLIETSPGSYRIDHDSGEHDDRVISLSFAAQHLLTPPVKKHVDRRVLAKALALSSSELWKPSGGVAGY